MLEEFSISTHENAAYQLNTPYKGTRDQLEAIYENPLKPNVDKFTDDDITYENPSL